VKVRVPTPALLDAVGHAAAVAATKSPKAVLECVALRADSKSGLSLEATDLDVALRLRIPEAVVEADGTAAASAGRLSAVVREVAEPETTLVERDGSLAIDTSRSRFRIRLESAEEFPELPHPAEETLVTVPGAVLRGMIRRTAFATAKEPGRFALHGVLFRLAQGNLELVATDGRRLARAVHALGTKPKKGAAEVKVLVGTKGLALLDRVLGPEPGDVSIGLQERQILFRTGDALVISRLIDGSFPSYEDVIPKPSGKAFALPAADLSAALRRASLLTTRDAISVQFDVSSGLLTVRSRAVEVGEAEAEVPITYDGPPERLGFNPQFLLDALKVIDPTREVRFEFSSAKAPGKLTDDENFVYVVMPIALE
jgi:DNA polymerase-3 subunit beta